MNKSQNPSVEAFLVGKSEHTLELFHHFIAEFEALGNMKLEATKTMIAVDNGQKRIAWNACAQATALAHHAIGKELYSCGVSIQ